jgi:hypothetical protein
MRLHILLFAFAGCIFASSLPSDSYLSEIADVYASEDNIESRVQAVIRTAKHVKTKCQLQTLPNGNFTTSFLEYAAEVAGTDFLISSHFAIDAEYESRSMLSDTFKVVKLALQIPENESFESALYEKMQMLMARFCIANTVKLSKCTDEASRRDHLLTSDKTAYCVCIFVHDGIKKGFQISEKLALAFLEYIYKYSRDCFYYRSAFPSLYALIKSTNTQKMFEMFVKNFNPSRQPLPVISANVTSASRDVFDTFIFGIYNKLSAQVDPVRDSYIYSSHMRTLICSILFSNSIEAFTGILTESLPLVDKQLLLSFSYFVTVACKVLEETTEDSFAFGYIKNIMTNEVTISNIRGIDMPSIGKIYHTFKLHHENAYQAAVEGLSQESQKNVRLMIKYYRRFLAMSTRAKSISLLPAFFFDFTREELIAHIADLEELKNYYHIMYSVDPQMTSNVLLSIGKMMRELHHDPRMGDKPELRFYYFKMFFTLLSLSVKNNFIRQNSKNVFVILLRSFTRSVSILPDDEEETRSLINLINLHTSFLISRGDFFKSTRDYSIFFDFLKHCTKSQDESIAEFSETLLEVLMNGSSVESEINSIKLVKSISDVVGMDCSNVIAAFASEKVAEFIHDSMSDSVDSAKKQSILILLANLVGGHELSSIQLIIVNEALKHIQK